MTPSLVIAYTQKTTCDKRENIQSKLRIAQTGLLKDFMEPGKENDCDFYNFNLLDLKLFWNYSIQMIKNKF